jgi:hypothetical protein
MFNIYILLRSIFSRNDYNAEPYIEIGDEAVQNPVVTIVVGNKRLSLSTSQARAIWGKLGQNLERLTPDPKEYRQ